MLQLCGFAASNYHNVVKLALLEKGVPFEEKLVYTKQIDKAASPMGKVPYLVTEHGALCESTVLMDYIEAAHPTPPLVPADAFGAAKVRELVRVMELHLELVARTLYIQSFFGGQVSESVKERTLPLLQKGAAALKSLAQFSPFIAGEHFTMADCAASQHLPNVMATAKSIYGIDLFADLPVRDYLARLAERPTVQKVNADRKANMAEFLAYIKSNY